MCDTQNYIRRQEYGTAAQSASPSPILSIGYRLNQFSFRVNDLQSQGDSAIQAVGSAGHSRVIGPDGHLHLVEYPLIVDAILDERGGGLFDAHIHRPDIVSSADD